jgi:hypothetical protein
MSIKDDGGPAFPRPASTDHEFDARIPSQIGMTLRDYFAANVMQGLVIEDSALAAKVAYQFADAMLAERAK